MKKTLNFLIIGSIFMALFTGINTSTFSIETTYAKEEAPKVHFFGREDCKFCQKEKQFLKDLSLEMEIEVFYYDVVKDESAKKLFEEVTKVNNLSRVTPLTLVGGKVIQGFDVYETTGEVIKNGIRKAIEGSNFEVDVYLEKREVFKSSKVCEEDLGTSCGADDRTFTFKLPFFGIVNLQDFSLVGLAVVLGLVDGFNPCAMWVLVTFLLILLQIGDKRKMFQVAGLFIFAEAVMYYLILNVWYQTWDFVGLDAVVTPLVGVVAIGGGMYFLYKYFKSRGALTCDVSSIEYQSGVEAKIKKLVSSPLTLITVVGIIGIALSVNIIEFACSIGIPQAFTKILEINALSFWSHQFYLLMYILFYMLDDFIIFGLALYGFNKIHLSYKYSHLSSLIGGVLMLILGTLLIFFPNFLIFGV